MNMIELQNQIPDYGRDIRLNVESLLQNGGAAGLTDSQLWAISLACSYALKNKDITESIVHAGEASLSPELIVAAKSAATIMAMNNIYYRFLHLSDDKEFSKMPARLRMNVIGKPGIDKVDFELMCLAVSAISGCGMCINAHIAEVRKANISNDGIQSAIKIASVLNAVSQALAIG